jgi:hypothetical protein
MGTLIDGVLTVAVPGVCLIAIGLDLAALIEWAIGRWR